MDKPRTIQYKKTDKGYMSFEGLNEYPALADIKYIVEITLNHFKESNIDRYCEFKQYLKQLSEQTTLK